MRNTFLFILFSLMCSIFVYEISALPQKDVEKNIQSKQPKEKTMIINVPEKQIKSDITYENKIYDTILEAIKLGHEEVIVSFTNAEILDVKFIDNVFGKMIDKFGFNWFIKHQIRTKFKNEKIHNLVLDQIASLLQKAQKNETISILKPINMKNWQSIPCLKGRAATQEEVDKGIAAFAIKPKEEGMKVQPVDLPLPLCAIYQGEDGDEKRPVIVIQVEEVVSMGEKYVGAIDVASGQKIVGTEKSFEFLKTPDERFNTP